VPKASTSNPFRIFERVVIGLFNAGVLSPAVLERVIGALADTGVDWDSAPADRSVDARSVHEIVVLTMLPGDALRSASSSFRTVVEHIAGVSRSDDAVSAPAGKKPSRARSRSKLDPEGDSDSEELLAQLSGSSEPKKRRRSKKADSSASSSGFNPFVNAVLPSTKKS
jgi:hypothetical protein